MLSLSEFYTSVQRQDDMIMHAIGNDNKLLLTLIIILLEVGPQMANVYLNEKKMHCALYVMARPKLTTSLSLTIPETMWLNTIV